MSQTVGITGANGFLGRATVAAVERRQANVIGFDLPDCDITENWQVKEFVAECDTVIHLAGVLGTDELFDDPRRAVEVNVIGTVNLLEACKDSGANYVGIHMPEVWPNMYQATKHCQKKIAQAYHYNYGVGISHVTAFNAFGEGQKVHGVKKIIPTLATAAWRGEDLEIWGSGNQTVDLIHSEDIANILDSATDFTHNEFFDAGTGTEWSVNDVAKFIIEHTGSSSQIVHKPMRRGELPETRLCAAGAGWDKVGQPPLCLDDLRQTIDWYKEDRP